MRGRELGAQARALQKARTLGAAEANAAEHHLGVFAVKHPRTTDGKGSDAGRRYYRCKEKWEEAHRVPRARAGTVLQVEITNHNKK